MNARAISIVILIVIAGLLSVRIVQELGLSSLTIFWSGSLLLWLGELCFQSRRYGSSALSLVAALSMFFLASVHRIDKLFVCKDCGAKISTREYFTMGFSRLAEKHVETNFAALVASDLGFPCNHKNLKYIRQHDYYGNLVCRQSGTGGMIGLWEDLTYYDADRSGVVAAFGKKYPEIGQRFRQSLINNDDIEFRREVIGAVVDNKLTNEIATALNAVPPE